MNTNTVSGSPIGPSRSRVRRLATIVAVLVVSIVILSGCKAQSSLTITLQDATSGEMDFVLTLDRSASQAVSQEAFEPEELEEIFSTQELQDAGFDVELTESDSKTVLSISSRFSNEDELQRQLEVFADPSTLSAELSATKTFTTQTQNLSVDVDISRIKENYLDDPDVQAKVEAAGIDFAEFEEVVEQAFSSTTLNVVLVSDSETAQKEFTSESPKETVSLESSSLRTKYLLNMAGGVASLAAGLYILVGIRRRSRVTSQRSEEGM